MSVSSTRRWLYEQWPYAVIFTLPFLLLLYPFILAGKGLAFALIYLQLPLYMIHQVEEHYHDRFRSFVNRTVGKGKELFTPGAIFVINSIGVWGVDLAAIYVAYYDSLALGMIAVYLSLVNGISHVLTAIGRRCYNPGLVTSILLFIPIGVWSLVVISRASGAGVVDHLACIGAALLVHALIIVHIVLRARKLGV